jgi:aspartyl-tRNA(Asn)/glutamyl-tRNA(Gln) amidotransferase subunit B
LSILEKYQLVVGLEVHAQLSTNSKLFCADDTSFGSAPNTQVSPISLAHPGTLPKLNQKAVELAVKLGIALNGEIESYNYFARKNYFYPDLPKGYQISQHTAPICKGGTVLIASQEGMKNIQLNRIHIEEDAGKSIHDADSDYTLIDLNRAGTPLVEIVTEPVIHSAEDAFLFLTELRKTLRWLDVCDGNMEEGSMRCDANISVRLKGDTNLGKRVEVKNLNSIRNVKRAIEIEFERLVNLTENNESITQETRSYDADKNTTFSMRTKEDAEDYRYFPEPDLPPFIITQNYIDDIKSIMPALSNQLKHKYIKEFGLSEYDASVICNDKEDVLFFESVIKYSQDFKAVANWMLGPLKYYCNENGIGFSKFPLSSKLIADLIILTSSGKLSFNNASGKVLQALITNPYQAAYEAASTLNLIQESDESEVIKWIEEVINNMPEKVNEYKSGKKGLIGLFSGEVKRRSKGKADMQLVNKLLLKNLDN